MDSIIKNYFNKYREKGELPPLIQGEVSGNLALNMPKTLKYTEENGITLYGRADDYLELQDKSIVAFDHKTKSRPPDLIHPSYQLQLDVYSYLLKMMGFKTTDKAFLAYYFPDGIQLLSRMQINCKVIEVVTNQKRVKDLLNKAYNVINSPIPKPDKNCEYCKWIRLAVENSAIEDINNES